MSQEGPRGPLERALVFFEEDVARIERALDTYQRASRSQCNLLVDIDGGVVTHVGALEGVDMDTIGALVAGSFAATREVAKMLGEEEFTSLVHHGRDESVQLTLVAGRTILATVYSPRQTTAGLVSFYVASAVSVLKAVVDEVRTRAARPIFERGLEGDIHGSFDALFGDA